MGGNGGTGAATRRFLSRSSGGGISVARREEVVRRQRRNNARRGISGAGTTIGNGAALRQRGLGARTRRAIERDRARGGR